MRNELPIVVARLGSVVAVPTRFLRIVCVLTRIRLATAIVLSALFLIGGCADTGDDPGPEVPPGVTGLRYLSGPVADDFERVTAPEPFDFPRDHGPHPGFRTEWWYFTGNLFTGTERHFGFELTFFRVGLEPAAARSSAGRPADSGTGPESAWTTGAVWMAHFAITDTQAAAFRVAERLSRGHRRLAYARTEPLALRVEDWYAEQTGPDSLRLVAATQDAAIDLTLDGLDRIVLQGERGYDPKGPEDGNASRYYSAPRLAAAGRLRDTDGRTHPVSGTAWLDREWGTSALSPDVEGWDWFALQLSDGRDLMYYRLRRTGGGASPFSGGSITDPSGATRRLLANMVEVEPVDYWRSERTGVRYPIAWRLGVPGERLELEIEPYLPNQEVDLSVRYWEGAIRVSGESGGTPIDGRGYLELAGY